MESLGLGSGGVGSPAIGSGDEEIQDPSFELAFGL